MRDACQMRDKRRSKDAQRGASLAPSEQQGNSVCANGEGPPLQSRSAAAACRLQHAFAVA